MSVPGSLFVISGPSGTGKGTICKSLLQRRPDMFYSVSATTRLPRAGETDGVHYHFIDKLIFKDMIERDEFMEWAEVYDNFYGTPKNPVLEALKRGTDVLLEIDVQGALKVKKKAPDAVYIFIVPPSLNVLRERIIGRGTDSIEVIDKRMAKAIGEMENLHEYNYIVINEFLDEAVHKVESIITAEKCRSQRYRLFGEGDNNHPLVTETTGT